MKIDQYPFVISLFPFEIGPVQFGVELFPIEYNLL